MKRVITPPPIQEDHVLQQQCNQCLCVFEFTSDETTWQEWYQYSDSGCIFRVQCPHCEHQCEFEVSDGTLKKHLIRKGTRYHYGSGR